MPKGAAVNETRIVSWNINSDRRVEILDRPPFMYTANAFKPYSVHERFPMISAAMDYFQTEKKVDLFALQEVEDSILPTLCDYLRSKGLEVLSVKYNPTDLAFNYIFAYDPTVYRCISTDQIYLTRSGEATVDREKLSKDALFDQHLDSEFEKSCQRIQLEEITTGKKFIVINTHLGLTNKHRLLAAEMLCSKLVGITMPMVLVGDFNQFDARQAESALLMDQIEIFKRNGFRWDSECLQAREPKGTFVTFPYDITRFLKKDDFAEYDALKARYDALAIREEGNAEYAALCREIRGFYNTKIAEKDIKLLSTSLDAVFSKGCIDSALSEVKPSRCKAILFANGHRVKPAPDGTVIQAMALEGYDKGECPFPSDHFPVLAKMSL